MGFFSLGTRVNGSRRTYEILQEHIPEKADWDYVKAWEADIPRRHGDQVISHPHLKCGGY